MVTNSEVFYHFVLFSPAMQTKLDFLSLELTKLGDSNSATSLVNFGLRHIVSRTS